MSNKKIKKIIVFLLTFLGLVMWCYPLFLKKTFGPVSIEQFMFHLLYPLKGTHPKLYLKGIGYVFCLPLLLTFLFQNPIRFIPRKWKEKLIFLKSDCYLFGQAVLIILGGIVFQLYIFDIPGWYRSVSNPTTIFRDYYHVWDAEQIRFPTKKNAIVIYMESIENTYENPAIFPKNYIPELSRLKKKNLSFEGFQQYPGTQWTMGGIFSGMCGVPLKLPIKNNRLDLFKDFLPSAVCIPQILQKHGYETGMILGTNAEFSGMNNFAKQHGFKSCWGIREIEQEKGSLSPEMMGHGWGLNDEAIFNFAKEKISAAAASHKPFFFVLETMDTHFPNGFLNPRKCKVFENSITDAIRCSSKEIDSFVQWVKNQPFGKDTAIILLGDHIAMTNDVYESLIQNPHRQIVNIFINGVQSDIIRTNRSFGTFDFAPTILSFMGAILPENTWGLGRNLLSDAPTVTELLGSDAVQQEIQCYSPEYQLFFKKNRNGHFLKIPKTN
ncbi:MAG: sulfatase-like hydrolase/transferase [Alphaproteobacteria bacterium]|nr:sulfatase-like hydrolase/transferase [Alphaproteobacteria bacterium]